LRAAWEMPKTSQDWPRWERHVPKGTGIYEDEPRQHRTSYTPEPDDRENELREADSKSDESDTEEAVEPPD